jgi:hypothetical protein
VECSAHRGPGRPAAGSAERAPAARGPAGTTAARTTAAGATAAGATCTLRHSQRDAGEKRNNRCAAE